MNFLDGRIEESDGVMLVNGDGFSLRLADEQAATARVHNGRDVILGIRPSDLSFNPDAAPEMALTLNVMVSEYIGAQSVLMCTCGGQKVTVEMNSETPMALGETLQFEVNTSRMHLFDNTSEKAL